MQRIADLSRCFCFALLWKVNLPELVWQHLPICQSQEASKVNVYRNPFQSVISYPGLVIFLLLLFNLFV